MVFFQGVGYETRIDNVRIEQATVLLTVTTLLNSQLVPQL
jgi:hypothetical protein